MRQALTVCEEVRQKKWPINGFGSVQFSSVAE